MGGEKSEITKIAEKFKKKIEKKIVSGRIILFGSRAKGNAKKESDVDLIVVSDSFRDKKYFKRSPELYLLWNYPYEADIICLTPEELSIKRNQVGIIKTAVEEGIEI